MVWIIINKFIKTKADGLRDYFRPDTNVLREIANYSRHVTKISTVNIVIKKNRTLLVLLTCSMVFFFYVNNSF